MFFAHFFAHCFIYLNIVGSKFVDIFGSILFHVFAHCFIMYFAQEGRDLLFGYIPKTIK